MPADLKRRVQEHFEAWDSEMQTRTFIQESEIVLQDLNEELRNEVLFHIHHGLIRRIPFFTDKPMRFITMILHHVTFLVLQPNFVIMKQGDMKGRRGEVHFLLSGAVVVRKNQRPIGNLEDGAIFGEAAVLNHQPYTATLITKSITELAAVPGHDFLRALSKFPEVKSSVHAIAMKRKTSTIHHGIPSWIRTDLTNGYNSKDFIAKKRIMNRGKAENEITLDMIKEDIAAFVIQRNWIACVFLKIVCACVMIGDCRSVNV